MIGDRRRCSRGRRPQARSTATTTTGTTATTTTGAAASAATTAGTTATPRTTVETTTGTTATTTAQLLPGREARLGRPRLKRGCSYRSSSGVEGLEVGQDGVVDLAGQVALHAPHDLRLGQPFLGPALDVGAGARAVAHADHHGQVQRAVGVTI